MSTNAWPNPFADDCPTCGGSGLTSNDRSVPPELPDPEKDCSACGGTGKAPDGASSDS